MNLLQILRVALLALLRNKMRSTLTTLGIVIGVGAVVAMVAIGEGAKAQVASAFDSMGTDLLVVMPGSSTTGGVRGGTGSRSSITWDDLHAIETELTAVKGAAPQLRANDTVIGGGQNWTTQIDGTTPAWFDVRSWPIAQGRAWEQADASSKVAVLGATVADQLFGPGTAAVGQSVRIKGVPYEIVGVASKKGQSPQGQDLDDVVFIPAKTFQEKVQGGMQQYVGGSIYVAAADAGSTARAESQVTALLRQRHRLDDGDDDDFTVRNLAEIASARAQGTDTLSALLAAIAAVSLLVGGIGIMNIMLVSVTERTREIGVRMAVGARSRDVMWQFLVESLALSVLGGALGVAFGVGGAFALTLKLGWPTLVRPDVVAIAVLFSAAVGVGFGLYPARKAAALDPIQALRYE